MNDFKIKNFEKANLGGKFPAYCPLSAPRAMEIRERIRERLRLPQTTDRVTLLQHLSAACKLRWSQSALDESFNLREPFEFFDIHPERTVSVNWDQFESIDEIALGDLAQHFDDIWYPSSDDIELFDSSLNWLVLISHEGEVRAVVF